MYKNLVLVIALQMVAAFTKAAQFWVSISLLLGIYICTAVATPPNVAASPWDASLPSLQLSQVDVDATSLYNAWRKFSNRYLIRSVLCLMDEPDPQVHFEFKRGLCTVRDVLDALTKSYPTFTWSQDDKTGVIWVYPKSVAYGDILSRRVLVGQDESGLPMFTGVLSSLEETLSRRYLVASTEFLNPLFLAAFDYSVDLPRGAYTARDILNLCCCADPCRTFFLRRRSGSVNVLPDSLRSDEPSAVPPAGAIRFWNVEIGPPRDKVPSQDEIISALASSNPRVRWAAREYVQASVWQTPLDKLTTEAPPDKALWVCFGIAEVYVRTEGTTQTDVIARLNKECSDELFQHGDPQLAVLSAFWLARLGQGTRGLEAVARRKFSEQNLAPIKPQLYRLLRGPKPSLQPWVHNQPRTSKAEIEAADRIQRQYVNPLHDAVDNVNLNWPGFSKIEIERLRASANPFQPAD